jgi:hypothetical protein
MPRPQPPTAWRPLDKIHLTRELRVGQLAHPPGGQGPRALPQRASRPEVRLHGDHEPGPDWDRATPLVDAVEAGTERLRHGLRRPTLCRPQLDQQLSYTEKLTAPSAAAGPAAHLLYVDARELIRPLPLQRAGRQALEPGQGRRQSRHVTGRWRAGVAGCGRGGVARRRCW